MTVTEWTAEPGTKLNIPERILEPMRYRFAAAAPVGLNGLCEEYVIHPSGVQLLNVLCDTSERAHGVTFKTRMTLRGEVGVFGASIVITRLNADGQ